MDNDKRENIFNINIDSLNVNMKKYLLSQLMDVWGKAEEFLQQISIHIVLVERQEEGIWKETTDAYVYSTHIDSGLKKIKCSTIEEKKEILWQIINVEKDTINQNKIVEIKEKVGCGNTKTAYDKKYSSVISNYDLYWYVENSVKDKSIVSRLIMKLIGKFLANCIEDIVQIGFAEENFLEIEVFKARYEAYNFIDEYVELIYCEYPELPDKEFCCKLSRMPYERRPCHGKIVLFAEETFDKIKDVKVILKNAYIELNSKKIFDVRKMLEVCQENTYLVAGKKRKQEARESFLLGYIDTEDIKTGIVLKFEGDSNWKISINKEDILLYNRDRYSISKEDYFKKYLTMLGRIEGLNIKNIEKILKILDKATHGALMIIADDARRESERLCKEFNRGIWLEDFSLEEDKNLEMIRGMASVDGAMMVDFNGKCIAYGVIVEGEAKIPGETERGSRYNASMNYIHNENRIAIIVSEDREKGMVVNYGKIGYLMKEDEDAYIFD